MQCSICHQITLQSATCRNCGVPLPAARFIAAMLQAEQMLRLSHPNEAAQQLQQAEAELQLSPLSPPNDRLAPARLLTSQSRVLFYQSHYNHAEQAAKQAIELMGDAPELALLRATAFCTRANVAQFQDNLAPAQLYVARALAEAQQSHDTFTLGLTLNAKANIAWHGGDDSYALALYQQAMRCAEQASTWGLAAAICGNIAGIYEERGDMRTALDFVTKALSWAEQAGDELRATFALSTLGHIYIHLGELHEAATFLLRGQQLAERHRNISMLTNNTISRAELAWLNGEYANGYALATEVVTMAEEDARERLLSYAAQVHCAIGLNDLAKARQAYAAMTEERKLHKVHHFNDYYYLTLTAGARLLLAEHAWDEAQPQFEEAIRRADAEGDVCSQAQVRIMYAEALLTNTPAAEPQARKLLEEANARFARMGATQQMRRVDVLLASFPATNNES